MKVNKKALYALAAYYEACDNCMHPTESDIDLLIDMFIGAVTTEFNMKELRRNFHHMEIFFKHNSQPSPYYNYICDREIAKLLRYIAKHEKFPPLNRLHYV